MKQFIICLGFTLMLYYIGAVLNGAYDPMEWGANEGTVILSVIFIFVWGVPITLNFLNGEQNFK